MNRFLNKAYAFASPGSLLPPRGFVCCDWEPFIWCRGMRPGKGLELCNLRPVRRFWDCGVMPSVINSICQVEKRLELDALNYATVLNCHSPFPSRHPSPTQSNPFRSGKNVSGRRCWWVFGMETRDRRFRRVSEVDAVLGELARVGSDDSVSARWPPDPLPVADVAQPPKAG